MFSLQTLFCKGDKFYGLLEASAEIERIVWVCILTIPATGGIAYLLVRLLIDTGVGF